MGKNRTMGSDEINHPVAKLVAGLATVLTIDFLTTAGKVCGALVSIWLLGELVWKRVARPLLRNAFPNVAAFGKTGPAPLE